MPKKHQSFPCLLRVDEVAKLEATVESIHAKVALTTVLMHQIAAILSAKQVDWGDLNPSPSGDITRNSPFWFKGKLTKVFFLFSLNFDDTTK